MTSRLTRLGRKVHGDKRRRPKAQLNSRGKPRGDKITPALRTRNGGAPRTLEKVTKFHRLGKADKKCRHCGGSGIVASAVNSNGSKTALACRCVPVELKGDDDE